MSQITAPRLQVKSPDKNYKPPRHYIWHHSRLRPFALTLKKDDISLHVHFFPFALLPQTGKRRGQKGRDRCLEELIKCMGSGGNARACAAVLTMRCTETTFYSWLPQRATLPEWAEMRPCCTELPWKLQGTGEKVQDSGCALSSVILSPTVERQEHANYDEAHKSTHF